MTFNVYFLDKTVSFRSEIAPEEQFDAVIVADDAVTRAKVLKILETCNRLAVLSPQPQALFNKFAKEFKNVNAAGGLVTNPQGEVLMIFRRGRWDLPKGHVEPGEPNDLCARREVAEETGISKTRIRNSLTVTYHAYDFYGQWELKRTQWYAMLCDGTERGVPQHEEGIERVQWIPRLMLEDCLRDSYPTIRQVVDAFFNKNS